MRSSNPLFTDAEESELCHVEEQRRPADIDQFAALTRLIDGLMDRRGTHPVAREHSPYRGDPCDLFRRSNGKRAALSRS
jgi:hypothetical protein